MADIQVHIDLAGAAQAVALLRRHPARAGETVLRYARGWLAQADRFSIDPGTRLGARRLCADPAPGDLRRDR
jgi:hypothetical protein